MYILGISAYYHDSAAALVRDGEILAAAQQERFTRKKHDAGFPAEAISSCLELAGIGLGEVDHIIFYDKPLLKLSGCIHIKSCCIHAGHINTDLRNTNVCAIIRTGQSRQG